MKRLLRLCVLLHQQSKPNHINITETRKKKRWPLFDELHNFRLHSCRIEKILHLLCVTTKLFSLHKFDLFFSGLSFRLDACFFLSLASGFGTSVRNSEANSTTLWCTIFRVYDFSLITNSRLMIVNGNESSSRYGCTLIHVKVNNVVCRRLMETFNWF